MATGSASQSAIISISVKTVLLVLIVFVGGMVSGIVLLQSLSQTNNNLSSKETLDLIGGHVWFRDTWAEAGIEIVNIGQKDATLQKIVINGIESEWNKVYYWKSEAGPLSSSLSPTGTELSGATYNVLLDGTMRTLQAASDRLTLRSQETIVLYVKDPGNIIATKIPYFTVIAVFTQNDLYYKEVAVDRTFIGTEQLIITKISWTWSTRQFTLTVNNTGTKDLTINQVLVNWGTTSVTQPSSLPKVLKATESTTLTVGYPYTNGTNYDISVVTNSGYKFSNNYAGGQNSG